MCDQFDIEDFILFGDFNIIRNNTLDNIAGLPHSEKTVESFNYFINNLQLVDIWRKTHGNKKESSWSCIKPFTSRRLDYILVSLNLLQFCIHSELVNIGFSDHKAVLVSLDFSTFKRGSASYKFNTKLLHNVQFVNEVKNEIVKIKQMNLSPHDKWEYIKIQIQSLGKMYGKIIASEKQIRKKLILDNLKHIEEQLTKNPNDTETVDKYNKLKQELDIFIIAETEGARIRSRQKWAEEGEKCTKYFLNLEKQRQNSNTIYRVKLIHTL